MRLVLVACLAAPSAQASLEKNFRDAGDVTERCVRKTPGPGCYQLAADALKQYLDSRPDRHKTYGSEDRDFAGPRAWLTGRATNKVYVLVHSYTMSPSELDGIAGELTAKGNNVISLLLEGHGSRSILGGGPVSLLDVSREDWKADTQFGIQLAHALGTKVVLVGYSLGGLLSIEEGSVDLPWIDGLLAIAPPVAINDHFWGGAGACTLKPILGEGLDHEVGDRLSSSEWRKANWAQYLDGACELLNLVTDFNRTGRSAGVINNAFRFENVFPGEHQIADMQRADFARLKVPYVIITSPSDNATDYETLERLIHLSAIPGHLFISNSPDHFSYGLARPNSPELDLFREALATLDEITGK